MMLTIAANQPLNTIQRERKPGNVMRHLVKTTLLVLDWWRALSIADAF